MRKVIYYFSGTGNNLAAARELSKFMKDTEIYPITELLEKKEVPDQFDLIGFIVPSYYSHVPPIVNECMKNLVFSDHQKIFSIIGCGGNRGHATEDIRQLVNACGKSIDYEYMLIYPGNYILSYNVFPKWYQNFVIKHSKKKIKKIAEQIMNPNKRKQLGRGLFYWKGFENSLHKAISKFSQTGLGYTVSKDCTKCSTCVGICPVKNITMENGTIKFGANCQQCMACIQWCPNRAIDYKNIAKSRTRYHNPDITIKDMVRK